MIDFSNASVFKLKKIDASKFDSEMRDILIEDEKIIGCYQDVRDHVVFTNKRVIAVNVQGITGKKVEVYTLPYSSIVMYSTENAGKLLDFDAEVDMWTKAGRIKISLRKGVDIRALDKVLATYILE